MGELELRTGPRGVTLRVRCRPGAAATRARGVHGGALKLDVAAPPERGAANDAAARWIASVAGVPASAVALLSAAASREKTLCVSGITAADLAARLAAAADPSR
ncbi:MAG TPA: DUF167 domain-containing protein [Planctomycetota bacterium]|nr:DUF167 domain-containing protein [Planctomycetota bacterium]